MPRSPRAVLAYLSAGLGAALLAAAAAAWFLVPVHYEVFALLKVSERPPAVLEKPSSTTTDDFAVFKRTQVQMIKSNMVLQGTLRDGQISRLATLRERQDDPVSWLSSQLVIDYPDDAEVLRIAMKGERPDDLKKIVDKIIDVYMKEVVERERDKRLEHEARLDRSHQAMSADIEKRMDALRTLEALHKTSGSESAKLKKDLAVKELDNMMNHRSMVLKHIYENKMAVMIAQARRDLPRDAPTAEPAPGEPAKGAVNNPNTSQNRSDNLTLGLLEKQKTFLEAELKTADEAINKQVMHVESLESYSATVAHKADDLKALQRISNELRGELDRIRIEKLAPERVLKIDQAALAGGSGDAMRKYVAVGLCGLLGLGLLALGAAAHPSPRER